MKKIHLITTSIFAIFLSTALLASTTAAPDPTATVYLDQPTITVTSVGQEFTVTVYVKSVTDLYMWQTGMHWDPTMLNCTAFTNDYSWFGPQGDTLTVSGKIDNTAGEIYAPYACTLITGPGTGKSTTVGKPVATATFKAKATGTTNIHLSEVKLVDSSAAVMQVNIIDVFTVTWEDNPYPIITVTNLTGLSYRYRLSDHIFNAEWKIIGFNATGPDGKTIFCNVTIPKAIVKGNATYPWAIEVDGVDITDDTIIVENATHTSIYFTYTLSTHNVKIWVVPEFPMVMVIPILVIATIVTVAIGKMSQKTKHRRPLSSIRMRSSRPT